MTQRRARDFAQVDVFASTLYEGNPVAVVLDGTGIDDRALAAFAAWTNLSETTFVLPSTSDTADYRLRIFTPGREIPFAGHPTLGSAHAWLEAGGTPRSADLIIQECGVGLVPIKVIGERLSFCAPTRLREGPLDDEALTRITRGLGIERADITGHQWVDNGPGWMAIRLPSAQRVLELEPDPHRMAGLMLGVVGSYPPGGTAQFEVRAFAGAAGVHEDPVTGSVNAGIAQWLIGAGLAPDHYTVSQGARVGRHGLITVEARDGAIWVGGTSHTGISGTVTL